MSTTQPYQINGIRRVIIKKMSLSNATKPTVPLSLSADATALIQAREQWRPQGVGLTSLLVHITAKLLRSHPLLNARMIDDRIEWMEDVNIGVATDCERGLMVPVIHQADTKSLIEIQEELTEKVARTRAGKARAEDMADGSFTISNLGMYGIEQFAPIINPPECAILGVGAIVKQPVAAPDDSVVIRPRLYLTLCFDHRILDGAPAARFLQQLRQAIESPLAAENP